MQLSQSLLLFVGLIKNSIKIMKLKIEIKNRWTGKVIFEFETENNTVAKTINEYVRQANSNLTDADLTRANLTRANLTDADLTRANLTDADLTRANLTRADLTRANLTRADLTRANLTRANLTDADLTDADLTRANLTDADLTRANLTRANLTRANLLRFKSDLWRVLLMNKSEVQGLKLALMEGRIKGSAYEGDCACLKGTIANVKGCKIGQIPNMVQDVSEPAEQWFLQISEGHNAENSNVVKKTLEWIEEFEFLMNTE